MTGLRPQYYALRRFFPYQDVVQVVEVGNVRAYSEDGSEATANDLMDAINNHPGIPFPLEDKIEIWFLYKESPSIKRYG